MFELGAVGATRGRYAERSTFLHPKLMFWDGTGNVTSNWNHHMVEDVATAFDTAQHRPFLERFLRFVLSKVQWDGFQNRSSTKEGQEEPAANNIEVLENNQEDITLEVIQNEFDITLTELFGISDKDSNKNVDFEEFDVDLILQILRSFNEDDESANGAHSILGKALVQYFDKDMDGALQQEEYTTLMKALVGNSGQM